MRSLVGEGGFEPPKSLTADLQSVPFGHSGIPPYSLCCTHFETQRSGFKMKRRKAIADMELFASAESGMEQASFDGGAGRRIRTPDLLITKSRKILKISFSGRFLIVFAGIEILFHVPVSTASVRSFPRVGHGVGQPFLRVHRVKTPPKAVTLDNIFLVCIEFWLFGHIPRAKTAPQ